MSSDSNSSASRVFEKMLTGLNVSGPGTSSNVATSLLSKKQTAPGIEVSAMLTANKMPIQQPISNGMHSPSPSHNISMMQPIQVPSQTGHRPSSMCKVNQNCQSLVVPPTAVNPSAHITQPELFTKTQNLQNIEHDHCYFRPEPSLKPPMDDDDECQVIAVVPRTPAENSRNKAPNSTVLTPASDTSTYSGSDDLSQTQTPDQDMSDKTRVEQVLAVQEYHKNSIVAKAYPTFAEPLTTYGSKIVSSANERLPCHDSEYQYGVSNVEVSVDEIKRRIGAPENMNQSSLLSFLRKKTTKEVVKNTLEQHNIEVKLQQRQKKLNSFSSLFEVETQKLAEDLDKLDTEYFPNLELARQTIRNLLAKGYDIVGCHRALNNTLIKIEAIVKSLEMRQPKVTGMEEKLKGNFLDAPYHEFSLSTHGFGHPNSLSHYRSYLTVIRTAIYQCEIVKEGTPLEPIEMVTPGVKPFQYMSDECYAKLQSTQQEVEEENAAENQQNEQSQEEMTSEVTENQPNQQSQDTPDSGPPRMQQKKNPESSPSQ